MDNLLGILALALFGYLFWQQRRQTELAQLFITQRCERLGLQLLSIARGSHKVKDQHGRWYWHTVYWFEFSADGHDAYQGHIIMKGFRPLAFNVPPHRMPGE
ncbi:DUF3301 domain-containing protein [Photobacterium sanctipauli]|uniref:DUF3301 domain-containing protein n=1 Tax=Photobacterium sanctipauli TaxID=1342794 RepID=A0A2T3NE17_9GAMM|nr:DUF3301 domain-containing protein [Photobacterium sanctipauli]PSW12605.1 DUF3301 domain-containing protein [Photobacterium sanctipauli]